MISDALRLAAELYEPNDAVGLLGLLIIGLPASLPAIAALIVVIRGQRRGVQRWKGDRKMITDIHKQAVNDHPPEENLREQMDRIEAAQQAMTHRQIDQGRDIRGLRQDVGELRGEDRATRADHDDLVRRLNAFIRREHPGADPL